MHKNALFLLKIAKVVQRWGLCLQTPTPIVNCWLRHGGEELKKFRV